MKKWILALILLAAIVTFIFYVILPAGTTVETVINLKANASAVARTLGREEMWNRIAPGKYRLAARLQNGTGISIFADGQPVPGQIITVPIKDDSAAVNWECTFPPATGIFGRLKDYNTASSLKKQMVDISERIKDYCQVDSNTYGIKIVNQSTSDTLLIATRFSSAKYPETEEIYSNIEKLKKYAVAKGLTAISSPMLNITPTDSNTYRCMVALPIDKIADGMGDVSFVRMVPGRFLTAEIHGGAATVRFGHDMIKEYIVDYRKLLMAMPFEHLITNRREVTDTSKWVTTLYYPVP